MTFEDYERRVFGVHQKYKGMLRWGQIYCNILWECRPDLSDKIVDTDLDPFYDDRRIAAFLDYLRRNW